LDEPSDSSGVRGAGGSPPGRSIYDRLMPLMYALIGAAATMFLNVLICGRPPRCPPARAGAVEQRLSKAIRPCVRAAARSFLLAVRLQPDGKVNRVFVARAPGVNAAMRACVTEKLGGLTLALRLSYAEWRVRQADGELSLKLVRHQP
jgi:hypothetical protein